ncbi:prepilin peptidase [Sphingomonas sp.]|uniref:prepilin peptidase n=1 Tax=Sphingomonas sp. TaxID=28214 RepID=UPI002D801797|nr:prepilin peptidase [Sphingomonas sp.]HEU0043687.1 prepilin peptidase [Sphingomonas sp.]
MLVSAFLLGIVGLILGSFIATVVLRWPEGRSVMRGRSACDGCGRTLQPRELVPLLSAALQRGRCRTCGAPIAALHWQVELAAGLIGVVAGAVAPGGEGVAGAMFGWLLLTLAVLDLRAWWLPDVLTGTLGAGGLLVGLVGVEPALIDRAVGGVAGFALLWLIAVAYRRLRGREGMGGGDPKLFGAIGLWLGWAMLPAVLLVASLIGLGVMLFRQLTGRAMAATDALPLGALLAAAAYPTWLLMVALRP